MEKLNFFKLLFNRIYHFLFIERFSKKLSFNFPKNIYRWDLIQFIIDKYKFDNYLEIGCDKNQSFSKIKIKNKVIKETKIILNFEKYNTLLKRNLFFNFLRIY